MAYRLISAHFFCFLSVLVVFVSGVRSATFTFSNNCEYTVWPGLLASAGSSPLASTGFQLDKGETKSMSAPNGWSGRFWGRTLCSADSSGKFSCATGDCGSGTMECSGRGATPPATLAEFTLNGGGGMDFYDASLVDGYNLPMLVVPQGGSGGGNSTCTTTGCLVDLNGLCPSELKVTSSGEGVACKSACEAFGKDEYCCSGAYSNPNTCQPTSYSQFFKNACPRAYSYAYDDGTSTFTCPGGMSYLITFCPTTASQKKAGDNTQTVPLGATTGSNYNPMIYQGALVSCVAGSHVATPPLLVVAVLGWLLACLTYRQEDSAGTPQEELGSSIRKNVLRDERRDVGIVTCQASERLFCSREQTAEWGSRMFGPSERPLEALTVG